MWNAFARTGYRPPLILTWLQAKPIRLPNRYAEPIVRGSIRPWCRVSMRGEQSKPAIDCWLLQSIINRFRRRNRETIRFGCDDWPGAIVVQDIGLFGVASDNDSERVSE